MAKQFTDTEIKGLLLLRNGAIWNSAKRLTERADVLIKDGVIDTVTIFETVPSGAAVVDITGCTVIPGLIDIHVHLREPGYEDKETIASGCAAAAAGGFTAVCCMPNTNPVADHQEVIQFIKDRAQGNLVTVYPVGAVSKGLKGDELAEIGFMVKAGIIAITDDGNTIKTSGLMRRALEYSRLFGIPVLEHPQDTSLTEGGSMNEGFYSTKLGIYGMPSVAEDIIVSRDIQLLEYVGGQLHIQHVSSASSVELIRRAKGKGLPITAEATPHHFTITDEVIETYDPNFKINPPLRTNKDREAIIAGLKDGTIDAIATDHAPHTVDDKEGEFDLAKFGTIGLETAVGAFFTELIDKYHFNGIESLINLCVVNPRKIMHLPIPEIKRGNQADICILNEQKSWTVKENEFYSKAANSCFINQTLRGFVIGVIGNRRIWLRDVGIKI